jgi:hypothetical protein
MTTPAAALDEIRRTLSVLRRGSSVVEVRLLGVPRTGQLVGFFDDEAALAEAIAPHDGASNIYLTLNAVPPDLLARAHNRLKVPLRQQPNGDSDVATKDAEVLRRQWVLFDCDAGQLTGILASDAETERSRDLRGAIVAWLGELD